MEYLWWGYVAYSGMGNGVVNDKTYTDEYKYVAKTTFLSKDKKLAKLFKDSELKTAAYRLPTKPVASWRRMSFFFCADTASAK